MSIKGFAPWKPQKQTQQFVDEVVEVINSQRDDWPLSQRYWLYRLIALKGWLKVDEYKPSKAPKDKRHLCTPGKNLNYTLDRTRRSGLVPWEAVSSSRGVINTPPTSSDPEDLADLIEAMVKYRQFDRQLGQDRRVFLWMETEGLIDSVTPTARYYGATVLAGQGFDVLKRKYDFARTVATQGDVLILHAGDLDKSGHTVSTSLDEDIQAFISDMGGRMELKRIALTEGQVHEYGLDYKLAGLGLNAGNHGAGFTSAVECQLEAMDMPDLRKIIETAFEASLDMDLLNKQIALEAEQKREALDILKGRIEAA